jgi:hypothetical protein
MLVESQEFDPKSGPPEQWDRDTVFLYCTFTDLSIEGPGMDGAAIRCTFENVEWYWSLFNTALFSNAKFVRCTFRGVSFRTCEFMSCKFEQCTFALDNLGGSCLFDECIVAECAFDRCEFVVGPRGRRELFTGTNRWYGCTQHQCKGLEGVF